MLEQNENSEEESDLSPHLLSDENQEARTFLRERFLRAVTGIVGMYFTHNFCYFCW